jgi:hypothetical protein
VAPTSPPRDPVVENVVLFLCGLLMGYALVSVFLVGWGM